MPSDSSRTKDSESVDTEEETTSSESSSMSSTTRLSSQSSDAVPPTGSIDAVALEYAEHGIVLEEIVPHAGDAEEEYRFRTVELRCGVCPSSPALLPFEVAYHVTSAEHLAEEEAAVAAPEEGECIRCTLNGVPAAFDNHMLYPETMFGPGALLFDHTLHVVALTNRHGAHILLPGHQYTVVRFQPTKVSAKDLPKTGGGCVVPTETSTGGVKMQHARAVVHDPTQLFQLQRRYPRMYPLTGASLRRHLALPVIPRVVEPRRMAKYTTPLEVLAAEDAVAEEARWAAEADAAAARGVAVPKRERDEAEVVPRRASARRRKAPNA